MWFDVPMHDVVTVAIAQSLQDLTHVVAENRDAAHISSRVVSDQRIHIS